MARLVLSSPQPFCSPECSIQNESGCDFSITKCAAGADGEADVVDADEDTDETDAAGDAGSTSASPSAAAARGAAAMVAAAAASLAFMNA